MMANRSTPSSSGIKKNGHKEIPANQLTLFDCKFIRKPSSKESFVNKGNSQENPKTNEAQLDDDDPRLYEIEDDYSSQDEPKPNNDKAKKEKHESVKHHHQVNVNQDKIFKRDVSQPMDWRDNDLRGPNQPERVENNDDRTNNLTSPVYERMEDNGGDNDIVLNREPDCCTPLLELRPSSVTTIFYQLPLPKDGLPKPYPEQFQDKWHSMDYIKMPFSSFNEVYQVDHETKQKIRLCKWMIIEEELTREPIRSCSQFICAIKTYNPTMASNSFNVLRSLIDQQMTNLERQDFFETLLPRVISLTLQLPALIHLSIPVLKQKTNRSLFFSQQQVSSLLANAFLCTYPKRAKYYNLPEINFKGLFSESDSTKFNRKIEKLKCILNYFKRVVTDTPRGIVTFERRCLARSEIPEWPITGKKLGKLVTKSQGVIEEDGYGMLQVDFANKFVGGGALESGLVQEEIRFMTNPELILSRLFTEKLLDNEVLFITGSEQYNRYSGYADTFRFEGDIVDTTPIDEWGRRYTRIVAMDASYFGPNDIRSQYTRRFIDRELTKAYCAFLERDILDADKKSAIASGNWGCGVYRGDPHLKALIQLIAASLCDRDLLYLTFNDEKLAKDLDELYDIMILNEVDTGRLYQYLINFGNYVSTLEANEQMEPLFKHLIRSYLQ